MHGIKYAAGMLGTAVTAGALSLGMVTVGGGMQTAAQAAPATASLTSYTTASGAVTETVSQVNRMTSSHCYRETRTEVRYYRHSRTKGWERLPAPARTVSVSTHCYAS